MWCSYSSIVFRCWPQVYGVYRTVVLETLSKQRDIVMIRCYRSLRLCWEIETIRSVRYYRSDACGFARVRSVRCYRSHACGFARLWKFLTVVSFSINIYKYSTALPRNCCALVHSVVSRVMGMYEYLAVVSRK